MENMERDQSWSPKTEEKRNWEMDPSRLCQRGDRKWHLRVGSQRKNGSVPSSKHVEYLAFIPLTFYPFNKHPLRIAVCRALLQESESSELIRISWLSGRWHSWRILIRKTFHDGMTWKNVDHGLYAQITQSCTMDTKQTHDKLNCNSIFK